MNRPVVLSPPGGFTLLEIVVTLAVLGLLWGISAVAFWSLDPSPSMQARVRLTRARTEAIRSGQVVVEVLDDSSGPVRFLPDGQAIGAGVDPLRGLPDSSRHQP